MNITEKEYEELKTKAQKWDKLGEEIAACYGHEEDGEWVEDEDNEKDLVDIGELAATAYGWF